MGASAVEHERFRPLRGPRDAAARNRVRPWHRAPARSRPRRTARASRTCRMSRSGIRTARPRAALPRIRARCRRRASTRLRGRCVGRRPARSPPPARQSYGRAACHARRPECLETDAFVRHVQCAQSVVQVAHECRRPAEVEIVIVERKDPLQLRDVDAAGMCRRAFVGMTVEPVERQARVGGGDACQFLGERPISRFTRTVYEHHAARRLSVGQRTAQHRDHRRDADAGRHEHGRARAGEIERSGRAASARRASCQRARDRAATPRRALRASR